METLIGTVPDGWAELLLRSVCEIQVGSPEIDRRATELSSAGVPVVSPKDMRDGQIIGNDVRHVPLDIADGLEDFRLAAGDILCTRIGGLGRQALAGRTHQGWLFGSRLLRLRPGGAVRPVYLAHYLALPAVHEWIDRHATGTAIPATTEHTFGRLPVVLPPQDVQQAIDEILSALDEKIEVHNRISRTTSRLRDTLAPLMMTAAWMP